MIEHAQFAYQQATFLPAPVNRARPHLVRIAARLLRGFPPYCRPARFRARPRREIGPDARD